MSFALWCYRCYNFVPVEHVNIKYNTNQSNKPSNLYLRRNTKIYPININEDSMPNYNEKRNSMVYQNYQNQSINGYLKKFK